MDVQRGLRLSVAAKGFSSLTTACLASACCSLAHSLHCSNWQHPIECTHAHLQKSKRGKVASRPSPKLTLEQLQAEQAAYESQRQQQQQPPTAAAASSEEEEEGEELYYGGSSSGGAGGAGGRAGGMVQYGSSDVVPEVVTNRMLRRVILFMGTPVFGGILLFPFFYWLKVGGGVEKLGEGSGEGSRLGRWLMQGSYRASRPAGCCQVRRRLEGSRNTCCIALIAAWACAPETPSRPAALPRARRSSKAWTCPTGWPTSPPPSPLAAAC